MAEAFGGYPVKGTVEVEGGGRRRWNLPSPMRPERTGHQGDPSQCLRHVSAGTIDKAAMREFDASCLAVPERLEPAQIKLIRESKRVSQPVFARYLNTGESTVEKRETGAKRPSEMAIKLLMIVQKHGLKMLA